MLIFNEITNEPEETVIHSFEEIVSDSEQKMGSKEQPVTKGRRNLYFNRCMDPERIKFNKIFESLLCFVLLVLITGCAQKKEQAAGYDSVLNSQFKEPSELSMSKIFYLDSTSLKNPTDIKFDSDSNIYIVEYNSPSIKIFDKSGSFINKFVTELDSSRISSLNIYKDTLYISYAKEKRLLKYTKDGKKTGDFSFDSEIPNELEYLSEGDMIGSFRTNLVNKEDMYIGIELKLVDKYFKQIRLISSFFGSYYSGNIDPEVRTFPFAVDKVNKRICIGIDSDKVYKIHCYDYEMNLRSVITNTLPVVKFSKEEIETRKITAKKFKMPPLKQEYKPFIESMTFDAKGNLWVRRASNALIYGTGSAIFDIFNGSGRYQTSVLLKNAERINHVEITDKMIYILDPVGSVLSAFSYDLPSGGVK
jgi:hypothetical protein